MRVIYTSKGMSKKFGVRVIYRKIRYIHIMTHSDMFSPEKAFPGAKNVVGTLTGQNKLSSDWSE